MLGNCDQCGNETHTDGSCPVCLLQLGMSHGQNAANADPSLADLPSLEQIQVQFPQLQVTRLIGRGGMGAIYHARQTSLDRDVALKLIAKNVADDNAFIERFEREAKTLAKLSHPNIVTVFDFGRTDDGLAYLIMEYVDGINLREAIDTKSVDQEDALEVVGTICKALEYAHSKGVVHRDIKPENILLGEDGNLKVADFGIAKLVDNSVHTPTLTATRQVLGSVHYLAPEQLESPHEVDHRVDLYALGVIFYELLTGQLPLGRYENPSSLDGHLDRRIDAIVMKTLSRKPVHRYQHASEISSDILELRSIPELRSRAGEFHAASHATSPTDTSTSVPFTTDAFGGFAEAVGVLLARKGNLKAEFLIRDAFCGTLKSRTRLIDIPSEKLSSVELRPGIFSSKLILVADTISTLGDFPNAETGRVELTIKKPDLPLAASLVECLGFSSRHPMVSARDLEKGIAQRWTVFAVMMFICCILNVAAIIALTTLILVGGEPIVFIAPAVLIGPFALLQFAAGLNALGRRTHLLAQFASVFSLIPVSPAWLVSMPTGIWALRFLSFVERLGGPAYSPKRTPPKEGKSWGATTMIFIRESRWSKFVAGLNIAALLVAIGGFVLYRNGAYPMTLKFRVVDRNVDSDALFKAIDLRLPNARYSISKTTRPAAEPDLQTSVSDEAAAPADAASAASEARYYATGVTVYGVEYDRKSILDMLSIERPVELVWLAADAGSKNNLLTDQLPTYALARGIQIVGAAINETSPLGPLYAVVDAPTPLEADLVSRLSGDAHSVSLEFSNKGRELIEQSTASPDTFAGLGLVVDGIIEAYASREQISGKRATFALGNQSQVTPESIIAAIRGPTIPCELEFLE